MSTHTCDLLVRNGFVVTMDERRSIFASGAVAIAEGRIVGVGADEEVRSRFDTKRVIDAHGGTVHPGMIDCHVHASFHLTRAVLPVAPSFAEHARNWTAWWQQVGDEDEYAGVLLTSLELVRSGVTMFVDAGSVLQPDAAAAAAEQVGMRASLADPFVSDIAPPDLQQNERAPATFARATHVLGGQLYRNAQPSALVRGHLALGGLGSTSDTLMQVAKEMADKRGALVTQHQSFRPLDAEADAVRFGSHPLVHLAERGVLGPNCLLSHVNVVHDDEIRVAAQSGVAIAWCPLAALHWGIAQSTPSRHGELRRAGVTLGLGSDTTLYSVEPQSQLAVLLVRGSQGAQLDAYDVLELLTIGGAQAVGQASTIGSLEEGKRADLVIRTPDLPESEPDLDPIHAAMLSARSRSVDTVVIDGRVVLENGRATLVDEHGVYALARASAERMRARLGLRQRSRWPLVEEAKRAT